MKYILLYFILILNIVYSNSFNFSQQSTFTETPETQESLNNKTESKEALEITQSRLYYLKLGKTLSLIISPILLVIGGIGNPLCICVLIRKRQSNPTILYLCLLAAIDFLVLYTGLLRNFIKESMNIDIRSYSNVSCKLHIFFTYTFMQISSYTLVAVTFNRFTIMFNRTIFCKQKPSQPNNHKNESTKSVIWIFSIIVIAISILNFHFLIYYEIIGSGDKLRKNQEDCSINKKRHESYFKFRDHIFGQLNLYGFIVFPCVFLFIMNILIIRKLMQSKMTLHSNQSKQAKKKEKKKTALSFMLVAVCLWFVLLKTPAFIYANFPIEMDKPHFHLTIRIVMAINYTNHAVNLILYIAISSSFRKEFKEFFVSIKNKLPFCGTKSRSITTKRECVSFEKAVQIKPETLKLRLNNPQPL